jgi:hypothetical protein
MVAPQAATAVVIVARISHPGYLAFIPGEGTWPGALGDLIASALNVASGRVHVGSDALVSGARRARGRVPARPGARDPERPAGTDAG